MNKATNALGAAMRAKADANNHATREIGTLILRMTKDGHDWAFELNDETPIDPATAQVWAAAVGVPGGTEFRKTAHGKVWRFEWIDNREEVATQRAEVVAFYLHGGKR
jgi:hypothetical protein